MDQLYEFQGLSFVWNSAKARANQRKHGVTFERATRVFFDPLFRLVDASRNCEARDAAIGYDEQSRLLYVVHVEHLDDFIRIISARKATAPTELD
jgi:uncharacterized DUF497 family protein